MTYLLHCCYSTARYPSALSINYIISHSCIGNYPAGIPVFVDIVLG